MEKSNAKGFEHHIEREVQSSRWYAIDRNMVPCKLVSFFNFGRIGSLLQFQMLFFVTIGLSTAQAGFICGIQLVGGLVGGPFWGYITDKSLKHGLISQLLCIISTVCMFLIPGSVWVFGDQNVYSLSHSNLNKTDTNITADGSKNPSYWATNNNATSGNSNLFYIILGLSVFGCFFHEAIEVIASSGIVQALRQSPSKTDFGRQMFPAPAGFAFMGFLSGVLIDHFPKNPATKYLAMYFVYAIAVIGLMFGFYFLFKIQNDKKPVSEIEAEDVYKTLKQTLKKGKTWVFFLLVSANGLVCGLYFSFSFLLLNGIHASHSLLGTSMLVNGLSACIFYGLSQRLTDFIGGPLPGFVLSFFVWTIRSLSLALMTNPKYVLLVNLLNGLTNSVFVCSYMEYIKDKFPKNIYTSICGIAVMLYNGGAEVVSYTLGGKLYQEYGGKKLFIGSSIVSALFTIITLVYACHERYQEKNKVIPSTESDEIIRRRYDTQSA